MKKIITAMLLGLIISGNIFAQEEWKFSGQFQVRSELDGRDFNNKTHFLSYTGMRTRVGVEKTFMGKVNFFAQFQDSRVFGEEPTLTTNNKNLDLKQGYVKLINPFDLNMTFQAGRFTMVYGTERFFGASDWTLVGRSWDGVRMSFDPGFKLDVFGLTQKETVTAIGTVTPGTYPYPFPETPATSLYGFWSTFTLSPVSKLDAFGYYNVNRAKNAAGDLALTRYTLGVNYTGTYDLLSTVFEGAYQFGKISNIDISAYLLSLQLNYSMKPFVFGIGADLYSGTDATSTKYNTVSTEFGTGHKFLGYMDYFGIPFEGINDIYLMASYAPEESKFSGSANLHFFTTNKAVTIVTEEKSAVGSELDLTVKYAFVPGTTLSGGVSMFFPSDLMKLSYATPKSDASDAGYWAYLMLQTAL